MKAKLDSFFGIAKAGSSFKVEIIAGIATFLAMAYILTLNPALMEAGDKWASVFIATAFGAVIGTLLMALLAKMPLAQAPGLGIATMVGSLVSGGVAGYFFPLSSALLLVFISGLIFFLVSIIPCGKDKKTGKWISLREKIFEGVPRPIRTAIPVGIGLFIAFIGLQNSNIIVDGDSLVGLLDFSKASNWSQGGAACQAVVCIFSLIVIAILSYFKFKGAVIIGILAGTALALPLGVTNFDIITGDGGVSWKFWENFKAYFDPDTGVFFTCFTDGFKHLKADGLGVYFVTVISFCMIDMFDTMGTAVGCTTSVGLVDEDGKPLNYGKILHSDSIATCVGAIAGTSSVTTFLESSVGIAAGGRTGFASIITALLFFVSIFILPIFAFIPSAAASSALIYVGVLMMKSVVDIDFNDIKSAVPAFLAIIMMPLTYSITNGIGMAIISYVILTFAIYIFDFIKYKRGGEKPKLEISIIMLVIFALFILYFGSSK